jgi:hypothetical protein
MLYFLRLSEISNRLYHPHPSIREGTGRPVSSSSPGEGCAAESECYRTQQALAENGAASEFLRVLDSLVCRGTTGFVALASRGFDLVLSSCCVL